MSAGETVRQVLLEPLGVCGGNIEVAGESDFPQWPIGNGVPRVSEHLTSLLNGSGGLQSEGPTRNAFDDDCGEFDRARRR